MDDICEFDEQGVCKRHGIKHEGRHYALSQEKSSIGHDYRKKWDEDFAGEVNFSDICEFDERGICIRHKVKHEGQSYDWSQDETMIGWKNRKSWDRLIDNPEPKKDCGCNKPKGKLK